MRELIALPSRFTRTCRRLSRIADDDWRQIAREVHDKFELATARRGEQTSMTYLCAAAEIVGCDSRSSRPASFSKHRECRR